MTSFSLSKKARPSLEITVKVGCGRMCEYCPQELFIESFRKDHPGETRNLTLENLKDYRKNISTDTLIKWTGFTEPLEAKEFPSMVEFLNEEGFEQTISTTLCGVESSINYFLSNLIKFSAITLHLPDSAGLMKGKFTQRYANTLHDFITRYSISEIKPQVDLFLIGDDWHPSIKEIVDHSRQIFSNENIVKAKYLNTRNSTIKVENFGLKVTQRASNSGAFYCSYQRLNQGVLLPNGNVALCCQDYGLEFSLGSLRTNKLTDLYHVIEKDPVTQSLFVDGKFNPCTKCEHYQSIEAPLSTERTQ